MDAGLLDVLHDAADDDGAGRVGDRIDVELERVLEELVDQDRMLGRGVDGVRHVAVERRRCRRRSPSRGRRARRTAARRPGSRSSAATSRASSRRRRGAARRLRNAEIPQQLREPLAVLGQVDRIGRGAEDPDAGLLQRQRQLQRRLPAELHDARRRRRRPSCSRSMIGDHVLERQRLEVQPVDGVVVGRHRLRVAVDHHRLEALLAQREGGVTAAVVELDALADAVRAAAEDDDLRARRRIRLALLLVACRTDTA